MSKIFERLKKESLYAQNSNLKELLYETLGKSKMAYELKTITYEQHKEIVEMTVVYMNTNKDYIKKQNEMYLKMVK